MLAPCVGDKFQVWLGVKVWGSYECCGSFQLSVNIQALCTKTQNQHWTEPKKSCRSDMVWCRVPIKKLDCKPIVIRRKKLKLFSFLTIPSSSWQVANMTFTYNWHHLTADWSRNNVKSGLVPRLHSSQERLFYFRLKASYIYLRSVFMWQM